jgi:signal transduction histidine kinase
VTRRSLRARLTLVFCALTGLVLGFAAIGAEALVERAIWASVDASLTEEAETLATIAATGKPSLAETVAQIGREREPGPDKFVRVFAPDRALLASFGTAPAWLSPDARSVEMRAERGRTFRAASYHAPDGQICAIGVRVDRQIQHRFRSRVAVGAALVVVVGLLGTLAWIVTGHATVELERLAAELETIEAASLDRRLAPRTVSEVDRLASVLNRLLARLERAMISLRRFTADAAHELRTPIAALRTHLDLAAGSDGPARGDRLADAVQQAERLQILAESLLTLSALEGAEAAVEPVALDGIAREVCEFFEPLAQEQGRPFRFTCESPVAVIGTPALLKRLLLNLVDNALRHTPASAAVEVRIREIDGHALIEVVDEGPGIRAEELPKVFERFHRGRGAAAAGGSGLGLAICREIVTRHRGEIALESRLESGTRAWVRLPLS